ncbi:MAG: ATP-binding cassette domain-containing protein, partial [Candidatus Glassbacteria bacterium]
MLEAIDLTKRYEDGLLALDHLTLSVEAGEIFCLLGANGAGKTTTINLFLNLIEPTEGTARICGWDVVKEPLSAKEHVSFVSENVRLYATFTARQNLEFFSRLGGRSDRDRARVWMELGPRPAEELLAAGRRHLSWHEGWGAGADRARSRPL